MKRLALLLSILLLAAPAWAKTPAKEPIIIGEISEMKLWPAYATNQRRGFDLALEEINAKGGVLGRPLKMLSRDGGEGTAEDVLRDVEELTLRQGIRIITGGGPDHVGLAISNFAKKKGVFYLRGVNGTTRHIWQEGHDLTARFDVPNYIYGNVLAEAAAKLPAKRWAFVGQDVEFGHSVIADFKKALKKKRPDVEFVGDQWHPLFKINGTLVARALKHAKPDALFVTTVGPDLVQFLRAGRKINLFDNVQVLGFSSPESVNPIGKEAPEGWIALGYPYDQIEHPAHKKFVVKYRTKYNEDVGYFSFVGYNTMISLAQAIEKAGSDDPHKVATATKDMTFESLIGPLTYRASDNQSNLGVWLGKTGFINDKPTLVDWTYESGDKYYPGDEYVKTVRPQQK